MTIALSMIVRNAEKTIARAAQPFLGVFDEIVVADTGSSDRTIEILRDLGAKIFPHEWRDDFSAARNAALDASDCDWFFSLDSDEYVTMDDARQIARIADAGECDACMFDTKNFVSQPDDGTVPTEGEERKIGPAYFMSIKVRLARKRLPGAQRDLRWRGAVHELTDIDARDLGYRITSSPIVVMHDGLVGGLRSDYYRRICEQCYERGEAHAGMLFVLGLEGIREGNRERAERFLRAAIKMEPGFASPYEWLAKFLHRTGHSEDALSLLHDGLNRCARSPLIGRLVAEAIRIHRDLGEKECVVVMIELGGKLCRSDPYYLAEARK